MDLDSYIRGLVNQGYSLQSIKATLLKYGYPEEQVDRAIYNINRPEVKHTIHLTKTSLIAIIIIVLGLITASFIIFRPKSGPETLLDVSIESIDESIKPGDTLSATISLSNMGSSKRYDIFMKYEIFPESSSERITFKSETIALETTASQNVQIRIPKNVAPGKYTFKVTARHMGQAPEAEHHFTIEGDSIPSEPTCYDRIKNQGEEEIDCGGPCSACRECPDSCDDDDASTRDYCSAATDYRCKHESIAKCGDGKCSSSESKSTCPEDCEDTPTISDTWKELERIKELAQSDPDQAARECSSVSSGYVDMCLENVGKIASDPEICQKIYDDYYKDRCLYEVAKALEKSVLCEDVSEKKRNTCYGHFVAQGDYTVCDKITNEHLQKNCFTLKGLAESTS